jgi:hypothetical protein
MLYTVTAYCKELNEKTREIEIELYEVDELSAIAKAKRLASRDFYEVTKIKEELTLQNMI